MKQRRSERLNECYKHAIDIILNPDHRAQYHTSLIIEIARSNPDVLVEAHKAVFPEPKAEPDYMIFARAGKKIDAIKAYRIATGADLKEAKGAIERLQMELKNG